MPRSRRLYPAIELGPLPVEIINAVLGTELEPGNVRLSSEAHRHIAEDHAEDYQICMLHLRPAIAAPTFIGQAPRRHGNFEIVRRINHPEGKALLVAIGLEMDEFGDYRVRTAYLLEALKVSTRRSIGRLRPPPPR